MGIDQRQLRDSSAPAEAVRTLEERIFPSGEPRDGRILHLDLVGSWESQLIGVGRLTAFMSPRLLKASHAADDMGLYVVFLQRHRVEIGLKLILERAMSPVLGTHSIETLTVACEKACKAAGFADAWRDFEQSQSEYAKLIHAIDPGAATFRYPVDKNSQAWSRRGLVDLEQLETAGKAFEDDVLLLIHALEPLEPIPATERVDEVALELRDLVRACRGMVRAQEHTTSSLRRERDRLGGLTRTKVRRYELTDADAGAASVVDVTNALATRADRMLSRIVDAHDLQLPPEPDYEPLTAIPKMSPTFDVANLKAQQDAQMKWYVDEFVRWLRPLMRAVGAVERRSVDWSTPAARQLYLDVVRFRLRLGTARKAQAGDEAPGAPG